MIGWGDRVCEKVCEMRCDEVYEARNEDVLRGCVERMC